ncbi:MAG: polysaccharide biosynthesis tyrosine autokinase [Chitinispirillaceae bacterium]|nr:polysaccharide biosynthesis tyrosine autokinase [Chitinispirillaceae bacterium]
MKPKKFSLGDIVRKLNEEAAKRQVQPDEPTRPTSENRGPEPVYANEPPVTAPSESNPEIEKPPSAARENKPRHASEAFSATFHPDREPAYASEAMHSRQGSASSFPPHAPQAPHISRQKEDEEEVEFDLFRYIGVILRRRNTVIAITLVFTLFSVFQYLRGDKFFSAHARLLFKPEEKQIIGDQMFHYSGDREKAFNTHLELLRSNTVLNIVSDNLGGKARVESIRGNLTISQGQTNREKNDIIELSYKHRKAEVARDVLNELCKTYIDYRLDVNSQEITRLLYKFEQPIKKLQKELDEKESALREFKEEHHMVQLSDETSLTMSKLTDMEIELQKTQLGLVEARERLASHNSQITKQELTIVQSITFNDPIKDRLAQLELEYNTLSAENSPEHYKVKMIRQQIEKLKSAAVDSMTEAASRTLVKNPIRQDLVQSFINLTIERSALDAKRIALEQVIEKLNTELLKLPSIEQKYAFLQRQTESLLQTLRMLKTKYEETKIRRESQETDIKILELAELPVIAEPSVKPVSIIIGLLIGLILGIALAFLFEYIDQSVKDPTDVEKGLNLPLLGIVPLIETNKALIQRSADLTKTILEPFRALRANLKHLAAVYNSHTFMVCSAVKGEGKTTLAANLAITFALDGKKVILIDADLRRSQMHTLFSISNKGGLTDFLLGTKTVDEIMQNSVYDELKLITSGERPHNPAELLGTYRFDLLIKELRHRADIIIFDSPALLPVSDTLTMAPKMDACIFILRTMWTPLKAAKQAIHQLSRIGCHVLGGIFNGVSPSRAYYPYYYGYYGYYSYSKYSYDDETHKKFSWRTLGLALENRVKNSGKALRYSLPRHSAALGRFSAHLARKKGFWLLLVLFLSLTGTELWLSLRPAPAPNVQEEGITYLGIGGTEQQGVSPSPMPHKESATVPAPDPPGIMRDSAVAGGEKKDHVKTAQTPAPIMKKQDQKPEAGPAAISGTDTIKQDATSSDSTTNGNR